MSTTLRDKYIEYLTQLGSRKLNDPVRFLGAALDGDDIIIPLFGQPYRIATDRIIDNEGRSPTDGVGIVLCQYVLRNQGRVFPDGELVTFRELPGSGPLVASFTANTNKLIASAFADRLDGLQKRVLSLHGKPQPGQGGWDLSVRFAALPKIPIIMQFNAMDDQFPSQCKLLFYQSAASYLDMQSLFILATFLAGNLIRSKPRD